MKMIDSGLTAQDPRPVSRGLKLQSCFIGLDSFYLVIEYPHRDIFDKWASVVDDLHDIRLNEGISHDGMVIRRGLIGYKLSIWFGDARLLITDNVDDKLKGSSREGQGMGLMLQLGPKWLRQYGDQSIEHLKLNVYGQLVLFGLENPEQYPIRLNRIDVAVDVLGLKVADFSSDDWRREWVGSASKMNFHTESRSRDLQGFSIGSSQGAVRFKVYNKIAESEKSNSSTFWHSVWGVPVDETVAVSRFEWSIKPYKAKFTDIQYLTELTQEKIYQLLNYASLKWGRLSIPQTDDTNQSRWPLAPLWVGIQELIENWNGGYQGLVKREYDYRNDISLSYLNSLAGWLAGSMVRVGLEQEQSNPSDLADVLLYLQHNDLSLHELGKRADKKWKVASKLAGQESNG